MRVGYLINQYPKVSHSFIRREIAGIEACGIPVSRYSVRSCAAELVDPQDHQEFVQTQILLEQDRIAFINAFFRTAVGHPRRWLRTLALAVRLGLDCDQGLLKHLAYFVESCLLLCWCQQDEIQHLHVHFGTNSATLALLCYSQGGPSYSLTIHGPEEFDRAANLALDRKVASAAFVIAVSSFGRSQLYRLCPYKDWGKIQVVHCGVDRQFLQEPQGSVPDSTRLVCVGRLCEQKGQALLIEAMGRLKRADIPAELVLVGDGPMRRELEEMIERQELCDRITISGWASSDAVRELILSSRALVLPSFAEGLPVVLMEALGLGRPVLSTYIAGIPELVEPGVNGWLVPAGSIEALTEGLRALLQTSPEQLQRMGLAGYAATSQKHDAYDEAKSLARLFAQTCAQTCALSCP
ncbi:MAG: glycosyltransferase family 4 protein [Synechococcales cyanobacterium CRU_2_2]|nr:glycosyltransferase family 4 protein [Synechococcales cyanobacterium CRU_2_2]